MPSASRWRSRWAGLRLTFSMRSRSARPRRMTSSTSGLSSHQGWTWMWASVTGIVGYVSATFSSPRPPAGGRPAPRTPPPVEQVEQAVERIVGAEEEDLLFVREVEVEAPLGHAQGGGDPAHAPPVVPPAAEGGGRALRNLPPPLEGP